MARSGPVKVRAVAAGHSHNLVLSDAGVVYSFGNGYHGRLGHGDTTDVPRPMQIEALRNPPPPESDDVQESRAALMSADHAGRGLAVAVAGATSDEYCIIS